MSARTLDVLLREGLERANPVVCDIIEVSAPDAQRILRRANDQFFSTPPRVSETPGTTTAADANGALILKPTDTQIANHYTINSEYAIGAADPSQQIKGMGWTINPAYGRVVLKKFTAKVERVLSNPADGFQLQIYRPKVQRQFFRTPQTGIVGEVVVTTFLEVLPEPVVVPYSALTWDGSNRTDVVFDLSALRPEIGPGPVLEDPIQGNALAQNPMYVFAVNPIRPPTSNAFRWKTDTTTAITAAGVGTFQSVDFQLALSLRKEGYWPDPVRQAWSECFKLEIEQYPATSALVYAITLPSVPLAGSTLRAVFERGLPPGTSATIEVSTAGTGGPWTVVLHGDVIATKQLNYHVRVTLNASASGRQTPRITAFGLDARVPIDVSAEATLEHVPHEIQVPFCQAGIGEGRVSIVRAGIRNYRDVGTELAVGYPSSKLEVDHFIGSRLAKIGRDRWLHYDRSAVTNRSPSEALEVFGLLSPLKGLKKKVPQRVETINTVHAVIGVPTTGSVRVTPALSGAAGAGSYSGKGYYMRVRTSAQPNVGTGYIQTINDNGATTGVPDILLFTAPVMPGTLVAGDIIEVHSAQYASPVRQWTDTDPADIWYELLTSDLGVSPERIGLAGLGQASQSGLPPKITDRAPGDATTQAKLKVSLQLKEEENGDKLIDQLSFLMGGCTVAVGGQIVFRQIYPLRDVNDQISVPTARPDVVFDARDYTQLQTPTGVEDRATTCACNYGVNTLVSSDAQKPTLTVEYVDADALAYLAPQDVEGLGRTVIPKDLARWCYNSTDQGFFLATQLTKQVVRLSSTGLRVWSWVSVNAHPELHVGDSVWIVADQYTDYDPSRAMTIRGWWAFELVIIGVQTGGRRFRGVLPGLGASLPVRGGAGTLPVDTTTAPTPAPAAVRTTFVSGTDTTETIQYNGTGIGALQWRTQVDAGGWSAWSALALPQNAVITRAVFFPKVIDLQVMQGDGQITQAPPYKVHGQLEGLNPTSGRSRRITPFDDGDYAVPATTNTGDTVKSTVKHSGGININRQFAKPLAGDPDTIDSTPNGLTFRRVVVNATDSSGNIDLAGSGWVNKNLDSVGDGSTYKRPVGVTTAGKVPWSTIDPAGTGSAPSLSVGNCTATNAGATGPPYNQLDVVINHSNMPSGVTFDIDYNNSGSNIDSKTAQTVSSGSAVTFTGVTFNGTPGKGVVRITAKAGGIVVSTALKTANYLT